MSVPQGSALGPLLFLLLINDLRQHIDANMITLITDDTSLAVLAHIFEQLTCEGLIKNFIY